MSHGSFTRAHKKSTKFNFMNKLKIGKEKKDKKYDRLNIEDIIDEEPKEKNALEQSGQKVKNLLRSSIHMKAPPDS